MAHPGQCIFDYLIDIYHVILYIYDSFSIGILESTNKSELKTIFATFYSR